MAKAKKYISSIVTVLVLTGFGVYFFRNIESFRSLTEVSLVVLIFVALTKVMKFIFNGLFMQWTIEVFTKKFSLRESIYVAILSAIGNFFGPLFGGAAVRAVYLKKVHKLSYSFFLSTLAGYYVILFGMYSLLGVASLLLLTVTPQSTGLLVFFSVWFTCMLLLSLFRLPARQKLSIVDRYGPTSYVADVLYDIDKGWAAIVRQKKLLFRLFGLGIAGLVVTAATTYVEFRAIGVQMSVGALGLHTALSSVSILVSVTPGAIGIKEGILVLSAPIMALSADQVLQVAVLDRGMMFITLVGLYVVSKRFRIRTLSPEA